MAQTQGRKVIGGRGRIEGGMMDKLKNKPTNYGYLAVRIVRLAILLVALPLYITAMQMAWMYVRPGVFLSLFLFLVVYVLIALFSYIAETTPFELLRTIARKLWQLTDTNTEN